MSPGIEEDGRIYYPVELDPEVDNRGFKKIRKRIVGLPSGEDRDEYYIFVAPCDVIARLKTKYAAVKVTEETTKDCDQWSVHGRGASQGRAYTGKNK